MSSKVHEWGAGSPICTEVLRDGGTFKGQDLVECKTGQPFPYHLASAFLCDFSF